MTAVDDPYQWLELIARAPIANPEGAVAVSVEERPEGRNRDCLADHPVV